MRAFDKVVVHGFVHMFVEQCHFHCGVEVTSFGAEPVRLYAAFVNAGKRIYYVDICLVVGFKRKFTHGLILVLQQHTVCAVTELDFLAVDGYFVKLDVAAVQAIENFVELLGKRADFCHEFFFRFGQNVRFAFEQVGKDDVVVGKSGIGNECFQLLVGDCRQFRRNKACCGVILVE